VVGAGIGGLTAARGLGRAGVEVKVVERAPTLAKIQVGGAIHLWHNGMRGLQRLGLADQVEALGGRAAAVDVAEMRNWKGRLLCSWSPKQTEAEVGAPTVGVKRPELHRVLADGLEDGVLELGRECIGFEHDDDGVRARFAGDGEEGADVVIGADGLRSAIRRGLFGEEQPRFAKYASWQSVVDYPADEATPTGLFRIVWGPGARFLFYRVGAKQLYWEGIFATGPGGSDPPGGRKQAVLDRYGDWHPPVGSIIEATDESAITRGDVYDRPPAKQWGEGRVTLLGDAAHPMTNAAGQGANQAIEDAVVLGSCFERAGDPVVALRAYEKKRIRRAGKISQLAWNMTALSRLHDPVACAFRDRLITVMMATAGKRAQRKDMAYRF
jgi:2-polyprenyl-6-methoxyphenol hydroxylase-like FAD-dependent oxidoreductase